MDITERSHAETSLSQSLHIPADFLMARMMLQGIKQRAERTGAHAVEEVSSEPETKDGKSERVMGMKRL